MPIPKYSINDFLEVKSSNKPSFSPDGKSISFLSNSTGTSQLYLVSTEGGDIKQLTFYEDPITFAIFSPTKNEILFGKSIEGNEITQFFIFDINTGIIKEVTKNPTAKYQIGAWSHDGKLISYSSNERNGKDFDVYFMSIETGQQTCIYKEGGACHAQGFSPLGKYISFLKKSSLTDNNLYLYNTESKTSECVTFHKDKTEYGSPKWLKDESRFYIATNLDKDFVGIASYDITSKSFTYIFNPNCDVDSIAISKDNKYLTVTLNEEGYKRLEIYEIPIFKKITNEISIKTNIYSNTFSKDSSHIGLCIGDSCNTNDIWVWSIKENKYWQVTKSHQAVPSQILVEPELRHFKSFDGLNIPVFIYLPKDHKDRKDIPVIVNIHGGPESQYIPSFNSLIQYFVYHGYAVISPNVRGSSGYGKKYLALDDVEKRMDSIKDLASLHEYIKLAPELDSKKVVLMGGSYGGYMALCGSVFYPELWAGGISIVGISNLVTFLENTAVYRRSIREAEYGSLDKDRDLLNSISPINYIENIKAPLLIIHGANDPRVPISEAQQLVDKLKSLDREVELLVYSDEGHGLSKLKNRLDAYPKVIKFLEKILN